MHRVQGPVEKLLPVFCVVPFGVGYCRVLGVDIVVEGISLICFTCALFFKGFGWHGWALLVWIGLQYYVG